MRANICGINIDKYTFDEVVETITHQALTGKTPQYVATPNAQHILTLQKDTHFREIYQKAFLVVLDGVSLLWAAKFLQTPLNGRVNGTDLFERLCPIASGSAIVATPVAMRGISDPPKTVQVAQQPEEFAKLIVSAVTSPGIDRAFEDAREWYNARRDKFMADVAEAISEL